MRISCRIDADIREFQGMGHRWRSEDKGLIWCWERGRKIAAEDPALAERAKKGELMELGWQGGVTPSKNLKMKKKKGSHYYLAMWQGLAGNDLNIDTDSTPKLTCSVTGVEVTYFSSLVGR